MMPKTRSITSRSGSVISATDDRGPMGSLCVMAYGRPFQSQG